MQDETFREAASNVFFITQIFALMPINNISAHDIKQIQFHWFGLRPLYSAVILVLNVCEFWSVLNYVNQADLNFHNSGTLSFYIICLLEHVCFWRLAINWSSITIVCFNVEKIFMSVPYRFYTDFKMKQRIQIVFAFIMCSALCEHCLLLWNSFHLSNLEREQCKLNVTFMESVYKWERPHLYIILPYHIWHLPILEWVNLTMAYPRSFTDVFIMCFGIGIATRFHQLHMRIAAVHTKMMPGIFWTEVREHYLILMRLVRILNQHLEPLILLAFGNNMYFICFQLFNSFKNIGVDFIVMFAFWYSLAFAIVRTLMTLFVTAKINDYTKKISTCLRDVPSRSWSTEVERFSEQLGNDLTAFSGFGFFYLTRRLILAMGTTIITYELMISDVINQNSIRQRTRYCEY